MYRAPPWHDLLRRYLDSARRTASPTAPAPAELLALSPSERLAAATEVAAMRQRATADWTALRLLEHALVRSLRPDDTPSEPLSAFLATLGASAGICAHEWRAAWDLSRKKIARSGIDPALYDGLRAMQPAMTAHTSDKNARIAIDRALWFETHLPIDLGGCASGVVKRDLRSLPARDSKAWSRLLAHGMLGVHAEPRPTWLKRADLLVARIGADSVLERVCAWLGELGDRRALRFEPAGADVTRGLLWIGAMQRNERFDAAVVRIADRPWARSKQDHWSPRHDRLVGALAYSLGLQPHAIAVPIVRALATRFGRTTARYPIARILAAHPMPPSA